jgi:hypothetical protein
MDADQRSGERLRGQPAAQGGGAGHETLPRVTSITRAEEARQFAVRVARADVLVAAESVVVSTQRDGELSGVLWRHLVNSVHNLQAARGPQSISEAVVAAAEGGVTP